jgi:hypothetical protein
VAVARDTVQPLVVEVLAPSLAGAGLPRGLGQAAGRSAPGPGEVGSRDAYNLLRFLDRLREEFPTRVVVHVIEPLSLGWIIRVLRHRPRRYPAFLVAGRAVVAGLDEGAIHQAIAGVLGHDR